VVPYVLPHLSKLTKKTHDDAAGDQRVECTSRILRLPQQTTCWFRVIGSGLPFSKEEHYKLARILVDIPELNGSTMGN
jgi:hypothetical protein